MRMHEAANELARARRRDDDGCAYPLDGQDRDPRCGQPRRPGSSYCQHHHALCYLPEGSKAAVRRLSEIEVLAGAVAGRYRSDVAGPPPRFIAKLEKALRVFACSHRS